MRCKALACLAACGLLFVSAAADSPATKPAPTSQISPIHDQAIALYMKGQWATLEKLLKEPAPATRSATMPSTGPATMPGKDADVEAIKSALAECRPAWWNVAKAGKKATLRGTFFNRSVSLAFEPKPGGGNNEGATSGWPVADMDDDAPWMEGLSKSELCLWYACHYFGGALVKQEDSRVGSKLYGVYYTWRSEITTAAYGTPAVRRHVLHQALRTFEVPLQKDDTFVGHRAIATLFMIECLSHPENYPTYQLPQPIAGEINEQTLAPQFLRLIDAKLPGFVEDCSLRAVYKKSGTSGTSALTSGLYQLAEGLSMSPDLDKDKPLRAKRDAWFKAQWEKLPKAAK